MNQIVLTYLEIIRDILTKAMYTKANTPEQTAVYLTMMDKALKELENHLSATHTKAVQL